MNSTKRGAIRLIRAFALEMRVAVRTFSANHQSGTSNSETPKLGNGPKQRAPLPDSARYFDHVEPRFLDHVESPFWILQSMFAQGSPLLDSGFCKGPPFWIRAGPVLGKSALYFDPFPYLDHFVDFASGFRARSGISANQQAPDGDSYFKCERPNEHGN